MSEVSFGSVCSGVSAASMAWNSLGWRAAWFHEIDKFPSEVLAQRFPYAVNHGSMLGAVESISSGRIVAPDILCGGTPCQAFSVAGSRKSLDDARGNLTLTFCEIANAIDERRAAAGKQPCTVFWENVPGVLNTKDNAFGCFLAGLAGEDDALVAPGGKWSNAGCVFGPQRTVAWRTLDAQFFGLAQRRRRVFVVASAREGFDPAAVLFEFEGVRRDSPPSREARKDVAGTLAASTGGSDENDVADGRLVVAFGGNDTRGSIDVATACNAHRSASGRLDFESETFVVNDVAPTMLSSFGRLLGTSGQDADHGHGHLVVETIGFNARQDPDSWAEVAGPLDTDAYTQAVAYPDVAVSEHGTQQLYYQHDWAHGRVYGSDGVAPSLTAVDGSGGKNILCLTALRVRRLMPIECERLQGFLPDHTNITYRNKPAADGPRYKAIGNSWAVDCVRWIGLRIQAHLEMLDGRPEVISPAAEVVVDPVPQPANEHKPHYVYRGFTRGEPGIGNFIPSSGGFFEVSK